MIDLCEVRVFLCTVPTKMNYSFDSLMGLAQRIFDQDPLSGHLFLFVSRDRDRLKILFWDQDGLAIFYKRLEKGTFQLPRAADGKQGVELKHRLLPKSTLGKAVWCASDQWEALRRYTEDSRLSINNNVSERTLRHQAIGRKNWLFLGSQQAGARAAILFTILAGAKRHRIEPWAYLKELLLRLHADDPRLDDMLPDRWAAEHPEMVLDYRLEESRQKAAHSP